MKPNIKKLIRELRIAVREWRQGRAAIKLQRLLGNGADYDTRLVIHIHQWAEDRAVASIRASVVRELLSGKNEKGKP